MWQILEETGLYNGSTCNIGFNGMEKPLLQPILPTESTEQSILYLSTDQSPAKPPVSIDPIVEDAGKEKTRIIQQVW